MGSKEPNTPAEGAGMGKGADSMMKPDPASEAQIAQKLFDPTDPLNKLLQLD